MAVREGHVSLIQQNCLIESAINVLQTEKNSVNYFSLLLPYSLFLSTEEQLLDYIQKMQLVKYSYDFEK